MYDHERTYEENLRAFLRSCAEFSRERLSELNCVAVILPAPFDAERDRVVNVRIPELNCLHVREMVWEAFGEVYTYLDEDVKFAVRAYAGLHPEKKSLYYLYIGEGIGGALTYDGQVLYGNNSIMGDPGQLRLGAGETFEDRISLRAFLKRFSVTGENEPTEALRRIFRQQPEEYKDVLQDMVSVVAEMLYLAVWMLDPHAVVIDCEYARPVEKEFLEMVAAALEGYRDQRRLPELCLLQAGIDAPCFGAVKALEKHWIATMK